VKKKRKRSCAHSKTKKRDPTGKPEHTKYTYGRKKKGGSGHTLKMALPHQEKKGVNNLGITYLQLKKKKKNQMNLS